MTTTRIFYGYIVVVGILAGATLVAAPSVADFWLKPYFWMLIAVALFDVSAALCLGGPPGAALTMQTRLIGFAIGIVLMVALPSITGTPVQFF
jgi:hypothetical protein